MRGPANTIRSHLFAGTMATYRTNAVVKCAGAPKTTQNERRKCGTPDLVMLIDQSVMGRGGWARARWVRAEARSRHWRNIKTMGEREWLCPKCLDRVDAARSKHAEKWGTGQ